MRRLPSRNYKFLWTAEHTPGGHVVKDAVCYASAEEPLHATIEEFAADGSTHIEFFCPRCRMIRLRPLSWLPRISMGLTIAHFHVASMCGVRRSGYTWSSRGEWKTCWASVDGGYKVHGNAPLYRMLRTASLVPWMLRARYAVSVAVITSAAGRRRSSRPVGYAVGDGRLPVRGR